jgi:AcrR family transcriptional regulator
MSKVSPRELILGAVVTCIEKYGIDKLTTRKIAEQAGTNIASINYYFRSKDHLVTEALTMTINHMMQDIIAAIDEPGPSLEQKLTNVFFYLLDGARRFPGISMAHLYSAVVEKRYDSPSAQNMVRVLERLAECAAGEYPRKDPQELRFLLSPIVGAIMFNLLAPDFFPVAPDYRLTSSENCRSVAERYARVFLGSV